MPLVLTSDQPLKPGETNTHPTRRDGPKLDLINKFQTNDDRRIYKEQWGFSQLEASDAVYFDS